MTDAQGARTGGAFVKRDYLVLFKDGRERNVTADVLCAGDGDGVIKLLSTEGYGAVKAAFNLAEIIGVIEIPLPEEPQGEELCP
jgi:hypothetical protein